MKVEIETITYKICGHSIIFFKNEFILHLFIMP
jgi:hypothetical protein